jgi:hypothetical protein
MALATLGLAGCVGMIGGELEEERCTAGVGPIQRLDETEYNNTTRELVGEVTSASLASAPVVTDLLAEQYQAIAEEIAAVAVTQLSPCESVEEVCAEDFIRSFGARAYRRPIEEGDVTRLMGVYAVGAEEGFASGIELVIQAMLQSPYFLYRVELGDPLTQHELASRLSYFLWDSMPDDALRAAADSGALGTTEQIVANAKRMIEDPRARAMVAAFHAEWLRLDELATMSKKPDVFPEFDDSMRVLLREETESFVDRVFWEDGRPAALLDPDGVLTQASVLSILATPTRTSPVQRGKFVIEEMLCDTVPPPPPNVADDFPEASDEALSVRERLEQHRENPACASCHTMMDSIGLGLEDFDALGRFRETEDASGELIHTDVDGPFVGGVELSEKLATSAQFRDCVATRWFRRAYGRKETGADGCALEEVRSGLAQANDMRELLLLIVRSSAFRTKGAQP